MRKIAFVCWFVFSGFACYSQSSSNIKKTDTVIAIVKDTAVFKTVRLEEVIVTGKKPTVNFKLDRQVYKSSQFLTASEGSAIDLVKNLPAISVNGQGEIAFRGSNSFLVMINGKPTQGDPSFVMSQISAASIENIELITNPNASFDADGKSGAINIITKTAIQDGWMLQANLMAGAPPVHEYNNARDPQRFGMDLSTGFRSKAWELSAGLNYLRNDIAGQREGDVYTIINNIKTSFPSFGERSFKRHSYNGRVNLNYQANAKNLFSIGLYRGVKYQSRWANLNYRNKKTNIITGANSSFNYYNENDQQKEGTFSLASLDYAHDFVDKSKISFGLLFEKADLSGTTYNNNLLFLGSKDTLQYTVNPNTNPLNAYRAKVDYSKKLEKASFQMGYQFRYDTQNGNFPYLVKQLGTPNFVSDPQFSSTVKTVNSIHAAYLQYGATANLLNYNLGLRLEHSNRILELSKNNQSQNQILTNLFPTLQFKYKLTDKTSLKTGYSRRIKRTNNYELNPIPEREHSETLEQGDAALLPELIGTFELGVEHNFNAGSFFATLYHQTVKNPIQRVNKIFNDTILNRIYTNAGNAQQIGLETNLTLKLTNWWTNVLGGNIYQYHIYGSIFNGTIPVDSKSWIYSINATESFTLPKNWSMQLSVNYLSQRVTAQGEDSRFLTPSLAIKKTTADKRWNFQLQWLYLDAGILGSNQQRITTYGSDFYTTTNYLYETDQIQFSIGFNLLKKNRKIALPSSEMGEKEF
jgi:ferric enterobactin receptor